MSAFLLLASWFLYAVYLILTVGLVWFLNTTGDPPLWIITSAAAIGCLACYIVLGSAVASVITFVKQVKRTAVHVFACYDAPKSSILHSAPPPLNLMPGEPVALSLRWHDVMSYQIQFTIKLNDLSDVCEGDMHYKQLAVFKLWYWFS